ncbi:MAG TPA: BatA and WFA domain-containing protein, partial [Acidobacteriota bacterium]|nr:BatA and WFA domain-containing protein [Acidobacteriota bacterium]
MIQFANPSALWLLTLLIPLIALYLLKHKRREVVVSTTLLWRKALEDSRAHTPFQKLRNSLLLFLQILIVVMLTAILSGPSLPAGVHKKERWILVLDASASMQATDEKPARFEVARGLLLRTLDSLSGSDEVMLISFAQDVNVLHSFTKNISAVRSKINELKAEDLAGNWKSLSDILQALLKEKRKPRIVIASDFANAPESILKGLDYEPLTVGKSSYNMGITRVAMRSPPDNPNMQNLFYQLKNFDRVAHELDVEISSGAELMDAFTASLGPQQTIDRNMEWSVETPTTITVRLKHKDSFDLDNDFIFVAQPSEKIQVAIRMENVFLRKALQALPQVAISQNASIVIADRIDQDLSGIFFVPGPPTKEAIEPIQWNTAHPSLRYVDAGLWRFVRAGNVAVPAGADVLIETSREPIAYAEERTGRR